MSIEAASRFLFFHPSKSRGIERFRTQMYPLVFFLSSSRSSPLLGTSVSLTSSVAQQQQQQQRPLLSYFYTKKQREKGRWFGWEDVIQEG